MVEEISDRFTQSSISITKEIEALLITAANLEDTHIVVPDTIKSKYSADINIPRLSGVSMGGHRPYQLEIMSLPPQTLSSRSKF